ncbi:MAG: DNA-directed RNA polymerase subunit omega [Chitinispirillia bacterium]|nr:DNA-directed RNA polymerase subunit omega [Chitinispirillia bacterium]MCL2240973.1 DNA-directed RNA polymerase subunit omega [Chitinispirillia bacterium]
MSDLYELELETLEKKGVSRYKAVLMASQEARYINSQIRVGNLTTKDKPTTLALKKLFEGRVVEDLEEQNI